MNILIIGAGNMGRGIATRLASARTKLIIHDVDPTKAEALAKELGGAGISVAKTPAEAVRTSDVVILASWYAANLETAKSLGAALNGKIVVDISNALNETYDALVTPPGTSAAETIAAAFPAGAKLVKAFNTTFAATLLTGRVAGQTLDVFIAGDDDAAKAKVVELVRAGGLNPVNVGPLVRSRELEAIGFLGIQLQSRLNTGFQTAWKLVLPTA